jgi:hypothetical protein
MGPDFFLLQVFKQVNQFHNLKMAGLVGCNFKYLNDKVEQSDLRHLRRFLSMGP